MKKLLVAASLAAGLAMGAVPAFAQSATASQGWAQARNYNEAQNYNLAPHYSQAPAASSADTHIGDGSRSDFLRQQQELERSPGYSPLATD